MFIVSGSGSGTGISVTDGYGSGTIVNIGNGQGSGENVVVGDGHVQGIDIAGDNGELSGTVSGRGFGSCFVVAILLLKCNIFFWAEVCRPCRILLPATVRAPAPI